ncbi:MAG: ABC transporter permease [Actinomycetota bacterium]|nr:ABC transporter permease [Actinomycetota bacterium]
MLRYVIRRLLAMAVLLLVLSMITFSLFFVAPKLLGIDIGQAFAPKSSDPATLPAIKAKLGLDKPITTQYGLFLKGIFVGRDYSSGPSVNHCPAPCLGYSFATEEPVLKLLKDKLPVTFSLALGAAILWLVSGVSIGVLSALRRGSLFDRAAMTVALAGVSMPVYFTGLVGLSLLTFGPSWLRIFPEVGYSPFHDNPLRWAQQLLLPWIVLAFLYSALYARLTRGSMLETMGEDFIRTARAKGLTERRVIGKHGLRAALTPIVTIFGLDLGSLLGGAVLTENVFSLQGVGQLSIDAIVSNDLPVILGTVLLAALFIVVANLVVDIVYALIDPKVAYS